MDLLVKKILRWISANLSFRGSVPEEEGEMCKVPFKFNFTIEL